MCVHVDGTANMCCTICKWFVFHSLQTKIYCFFFLQTKGIVSATQTGVFMFWNHKLVACIFCIFSMWKSMFVNSVLKLWFVICLPHIHRKLIYRVSSANCTQTVQRDQGAHVCIKHQNNRVWTYAIFNRVWTQHMVITSIKLKY